MRRVSVEKLRDVRLFAIRRMGQLLDLFPQPAEFEYSIDRFDNKLGAGSENVIHLEPFITYLRTISPKIPIELTQSPAGVLQCICIMTKYSELHGWFMPGSVLGDLSGKFLWLSSSTLLETNYN